MAVRIVKMLQLLVFLLSVFTILFIHFSSENDIDNMVNVNVNAGKGVMGRVSISRNEHHSALILQVLGEDGHTVLLKGNLGTSAPSSVGQPNGCDPDPGYNYCYNYGHYSKLQVAHDDDGCTRFVWTSTQVRKLTDCFILDSHWYGGTESFNQSWPIEDDVKDEAPMVTGGQWGIAENYWLISSGVALQVDEDVPLFTSWRIEKDQVCFSAQYVHPYKERKQLELKYNICTGRNLKDVHVRTLKKYYPVPPKGAPDRAMLLYPFWSTWAQYHTNVNQSLVLDYARKLKSEGFIRNSHIEIDDDWETCYGEAKFNTAKFPNVSQMVQTLNDLDFKVTLWTHPFINFNCPSFQTAIEKDYFVHDGNGKSGITSWWAGPISGIIDFTNEAAVTWWKGRLETLQSQYKFDSFKFDAGETLYLPYSSHLNVLNSRDKILEPNVYTTKFVEAVASFGGMTEVRAGRRNQREPIFTRIRRKDSRWGNNNGLRALIPTLLQLGLLGYPFIMPDMIGGNGQSKHGGRPSKELYIRWMQATTFMPAVQFSIVPWDYDAETVQLCKDFLALRERYLDVINKAVDQALIDGSPINRPMWWEDPDDVNTYTIDDQYMLGDDILVAPIVHEGSTSRNVYLPRGGWTAADGLTYLGPLTLTNYSAPLTSLPYFIKTTTFATATRLAKD